MLTSVFFNGVTNASSEDLEVDLVADKSNISLNEETSVYLRNVSGTNSAVNALSFSIIIPKSLLPSASLNEISANFLIQHLKIVSLDANYYKIEVLFLKAPDEGFQLSAGDNIISFKIKPQLEGTFAISFQNNFSNSVVDVFGNGILLPQSINNTALINVGNIPTPTSTPMPTPTGTPTPTLAFTPTPAPTTELTPTPSPNPTSVSQEKINVSLTTNKSTLEVLENSTVYLTVTKGSDIKINAFAFSILVPEDLSPSNPTNITGSTFFLEHLNISSASNGNKKIEILMVKPPGEDFEMRSGQNLISFDIAPQTYGNYNISFKQDFEQVILGGASPNNNLLNDVELSPLLIKVTEIAPTPLPSSSPTVVPTIIISPIPSITPLPTVTPVQDTKKVMLSIKGDKNALVPNEGTVIHVQNTSDNFSANAVAFAIKVAEAIKVEDLFLNPKLDTVLVRHVKISTSNIIEILIAAQPNSTFEIFKNEDLVTFKITPIKEGVHSIEFQKDFDNSIVDLVGTQLLVDSGSFAKFEVSVKHPIVDIPQLINVVLHSYGDFLLKGIKLPGTAVLIKLNNDSEIKITDNSDSINWESKLTLAGGENNVVIRAQDAFGNFSNIITKKVIKHILGDISGDGYINRDDLNIVKENYKKYSSEEIKNAIDSNLLLSDINEDGKIDIFDVAILAGRFLDV